MHDSLKLFQIAGAMAHHAGSRQAVVARNIAHADTPGYRAMQIPAFRDAFDDAPVSQMRATRNTHIMPAQTTTVPATAVAGTGEPAPNGNTVSLEDEMMNAVAIAREHSRALAIYQHTMTVLRTSIGRS